MFELKDMLESFTDFVYQPKLYRNQFVVHEEGRPHFPSLLNKKHGGHDSSSTSEGRLYFRIYRGRPKRSYLLLFGLLGE